MPTEIKKEEPLYTHYLCCSKCSLQFSIDSPHKNNTKLEIDKMSCPVCKKPIMLNPIFFGVSGRPSRSSQSRMNKEATEMALKLAGEAKLRDRELGDNKMIPVTSKQKGKGFGKTMMIPKRVIESIKEKIEGNEEAFQE